MNLPIILSAALMLVTAGTHSLLGERRIVGPVLALNTGVVSRPLARQVIRFAWHMTSVTMVATAAAIVWPATPPGLVRFIGVCWLAAGLFDLAYARGKHIGWPLITAAGGFALLA